MSNLWPTILPYLPPAVVRAALLNALPSSPQAAVSEAAVLFADLSGFTPLTEALAQKGPQGPEELTRLLNAYFSRMIALIEEEGGEVVKFSGDAVTVLFPALNEPLSHATRRAYQAALAMQGAMVEFAQLETSIGAVALGLKIGIGAGEVLAMQVGGVLERWEYVIAGDPLRQVAEAEHQAQRGDIILSPAASTIMHPEPLPPQALQRPDWSSAADQAGAVATCKRFIPGTISRWLEEGLRDWVAILRPMSVLFIGVRGLDYERADATDKLHTFLRAVQETLYRYEGSLNKLAVDDKGSILLALFGAPPFAHEDDPLRAVRCALDLQAVAAQEGLRLAIGVTSGQVFAGPVGGPTRREYTVMGDVVNLAARLMQKAGPGRILCDFKSYHQARHQLAFERLTPVRLKGKAGLIRVYRPTGATVQVNSTPHSTIIARQREVAVLSATLDAISAGQNRTLIIEGEAGIGKSRLLAELSRLVEARGLTELLGQGQSIEQHTPYRAWRDIFVSYFGLEDVTQQAERQQRVIELVQEVAPEHKERLCLLNDLLNLNLPESALVMSLDHALRQQNLTMLLLTLLRAWTRERPLILVLEDAHWLDSLSWELAVQVARGLMGASNPLLLVLVTRPLSPNIGGGKGGATSLTALRAMEMSESLLLESLSPDETVSLVTARLGLPADGLPQAIADLVRQRAEGNPFFAEELVFTLRDQGIITIEPDPKSPRSVNRCLINGDLDSHTLPDTLQGLILARIDQLPPEKQLTLKVAAVIGRSFAYLPLHYLLKQHTNIVEKTLQGHLTKLTEQDLTLLEMPAPDLSYIFKHIITQEVAYQTLLFAQRRRLHRTVAEWYKTSNPDLAPVYPLLVYHYHHAEESDQERHYAKLAGEQAAKQFANAEAEHYISRALDLTPSEDLAARYDNLLLREKVYALQGERERQKQDLTTLAELAVALGDLKRRAEVCIQQSDYAEKISDYPAAIEQAKMAIRVAHQAGDSVRQAIGHLRWGIALYRQGNYNEARQTLQKAQHLAHQIDEQQLLGEALNNLGAVSFYQGDHAQALAYYKQALTIRQTTGHLQGECSTLNNLAIIFYYQGDYARAGEYYGQALHITRTIGNRMTEGIVLRNLGVASDIQGDYARAKNNYTQALSIVREVGARLVEGVVLASMSLLFHHLSDNQAAKEYAQQAITITQEIGNRNFQAFALSNLGHALVGLGEIPEAQAAYHKAYTLQQEIGQPQLAMEPKAGLARLALAIGAHQQALTYVEEILRTLSSHPTLEGAEEPLRVYLTCYRVLQASPTEGERAQEILHTAHRLLQERAAKISDEQMRHIFLRNVAVHREIGAAWEMI